MVQVEMIIFIIISVKGLEAHLLKGSGGGFGSGGGGVGGWCLQGKQGKQRTGVVVKEILLLPLGSVTVGI